MHPLWWKTLTALLVLTTISQQLVGWKTRFLRPLGQEQFSSATDTTGSLPQDTSTHATPWVYHWERDRNDYTLTSKQCDAVFPELYHSIDRSVGHWRYRNLSSESIRIANENEAGLTVLIYDQQLRIVETKGMLREDFRERIVAVIHQLYRTVLTSTAIGERLPNMEFSITVDDVPHLPHDGSDYAVWAFTRDITVADEDAIWLIPDFHFLAAPNANDTFQEMQALAREYDAPLSEKLPRVIWRGVRWTNEDIRGSMMSAVEGKEWADVKDINWSDNSQIMPMQDYCRYMFVLNTEGHSWSSRMLYILNCDSLPIIHKLRWDAHFYHLLKPNVNCVPVANNFSNLEQLVTYYLDNKEEAQEIADNAKHLLRERYLTPAATACYWRRLLRSWRSVAFEPEVFEDSDNGSRSVKKMRGVPFEQSIFNEGKDVP